MTGPRDVLLLSTSTIFFSEGDASQSLIALLQQALVDRRPDIEWRCQGDLLYLAPTVGERAKTLVEKRRPEVVVFRPTGASFLHDDVPSRVRELWPRSYGLSRRIAEYFQALGGGGRFGAPGPRGLLFRVPRRLAAAIIGVAPPLRVEVAARLTRETIDALLRYEEVDTVCQISVGNVPPHTSAEEYGRRTRLYIEETLSYCRERRVPVVSSLGAMSEAGIQFEMTDDRLHPNLAYSQFHARQIAESIVSLL